MTIFLMIIFKRVNPFTTSWTYLVTMPAGKGATGAAPLRAYLETLGYTKEKRRLGEKEIWSKPDQVKGDIFYLYFNAATGEVDLTKVMND
ncbi:hypothetical protein [Enterobacter cloacae]|uniref:hypothetical protein n=1 Tax=Enterobacter cloacae TaxID=550 RepID=UPI000A5DA90C|nr:hypothetical protein [Enterobacter cloacae]